jgi:hypothetical protein
VTKDGRTEGGLALPFQMSQAILGDSGLAHEKPSDFVERWPPLAFLVEALAGKAEHGSGCLFGTCRSDPWTARLAYLSSSTMKVKTSKKLAFGSASSA